MNGLIVLGLGEPHRLFVEQHARVAQPGAEPRVIFQRADAAVDIDGRVGLGVAGIGDGDVLVARAVGGQHVGHRAHELAALGIAHVAQAALPLLACEGERCLEIDAFGRDRRQLVPFDRVDQPGLDAVPAHPAARQIALEMLRRRAHRCLPRCVLLLGFIRILCQRPHSVERRSARLAWTGCRNVCAEWFVAIGGMAFGHWRSYFAVAETECRL